MFTAFHSEETYVPKPTKIHVPKSAEIHLCSGIMLNKKLVNAQSSFFL